LTGFARYEKVLRLFLDGDDRWTVARIAEAIDTSPSNIYRTVRELVAAGYLEGSTESHYRLGPIFLEFDRQLRRSDALVRSGELFLRALVEQAGVPCCAALVRLYGNTVMCVADARSSRFTRQTSYERGRPMPILKGATSKAVLSALPPRKRERLLLSLHQTNESVPPGLVPELEAIRKAGVAVTRGEVDEGLAGLAVAVTLPEMGIYASLSFILQQADLTPAVETRLASMLHIHSGPIRDFIANSNPHITAL